MSQLALYRKYRSQTFGDLVGQSHVVRTLQNAVESGKFVHAYLFTGPRGTGKTSTARLLAKALNCEKGPATEPCNKCEACVSITSGTSMDVLEMDAASESGVDDVREAIVQASEYKPTYCRFRVFIIDEVHDLSPKAFDALLKTIEEPPDHVVFILATTEYNKVPPTIRSRCQRFEFHRGTIQDLTERLAYVAKQEKIKCEPAALAAIARMADGGFRDALTLLDQAILTSEGTVTLEHVYAQLGLISDETADTILKALAKEDVKSVIEQIDAVYRSGRDPRSIVESLLLRLSELTRASYGIDEGGTGDSAMTAALTAASNEIGRESLLRFRSELAATHRAVRDVSLPRVWVESELVRLCSPSAPVAVSKPAVAVKSEPVAKHAATPKSEPRPPVATGDQEFDRIAASWHRVVAELSSKSKSAQQRMESSRLVEIKGKTATIGFERQSDAEWVSEKQELRKPLIESWNRNGGEGYELKYVANKKNGARPLQSEPATVECPAEGESLERLGREVFGADAR